MTAEQELMQKIKTTCGPWIMEAIALTPSGTAAYPAALLAALTANESGGDPKVTRFESSVFAQLAQVLVGHKANFGAIGAEDLEEAVWPEVGTGLKPAMVSLLNFATSWGPTQIMGYQALAGHYDLAELPNLHTHYKHVIETLEDFRRRFKLPIIGVPALVWEPFFHCWNAGSPDGKTFDPNYTSRGLDRMTLYTTL